MKELIPYIKDGIKIDKIDFGYEVFTIPTQHFTINSVDELTPERFEYALSVQKKRDEFYSEMYKLIAMFPKRNKR